MPDIEVLYIHFLTPRQMMLYLNGYASRSLDEKYWRMQEWMLYRHCVRMKRNGRWRMWGCRAFEEKYRMKWVVR